MDLALNNLQRFICHKNPNNQAAAPEFKSSKRLFAFYIALIQGIHPIVLNKDTTPNECLGYDIKQSDCDPIYLTPPLGQDMTKVNF